MILYFGHCLDGASWYYEDLGHGTALLLARLFVSLGAQLNVLLQKERTTSLYYRGTE